jgi:hypothetical protein
MGAMAKSFVLIAKSSVTGVGQFDGQVDWFTAEAPAWALIEIARHAGKKAGMAGRRPTGARGAVLCS